MPGESAGERMIIFFDPERKVSIDKFFGDVKGRGMCMCSGSVFVWVCD